MAVKRPSNKAERTGKAVKASRWAGALLGVAAVAGSAMAQNPGGGQGAGREPRGRPAGGAYLIPPAQQAPGKVVPANLESPVTLEEYKKLSPEEKAQLRRLLKSGQ